MKAIPQMMASALALALCLSFGSSAAGQAPETAQPVYTNKTRFRIPFRYDAAEMQRVGAKEIRLYVSVDQGQNWQLSRQANPQVGKFDFEAPGPGEYWFAVRTLDGRNQLYPPGDAFTPGLKVIVDTAAPMLGVELSQPQPGKVSMTWKAADPHLDLSTLRLEYIQAGSDRWEMVSIVPQSSGQTAWSVPQGGFVAVRGQIFDRAGNVQQTQTQIRLKPAASAPNLDDPIAGPENSLTPPVVQSPFGPAEPPLAPPESRDNFISNSPGPSLANNRNAPPARTGLPPKLTNQTRVVNSRIFQIGYKVEDVGPSGVGDVELFITENDGAKWYKYGSDPDRATPFQVETPRDGVYGFALRVKSGAGLAAEPPKPGEKPSIVVVVDSTPPRVELLSADQGQGKNLNRIVLRWMVEDDYPSETPISLSYAADPSGAWEPITTWISDSGEYTWSAGPNAPGRLYFRVTARDAAGNISQTQTQNPVIVDLSKPSARIVDVESIDTSSPPRR